MDQSQAAIPRARKTYYDKVTVYFSVATTFFAFTKNTGFRIVDKRHSKDDTSFVESLVFIITVYCWLLGYRQTLTILVDLFSFPESIGNTIFASFSSSFLLCYCFVPHFWYRGCMGFDSPPLAIRAGIMSTALIPFIFSVSGK